jgi:hypothetical protein
MTSWIGMNDCLTSIIIARKTSFSNKNANYFSCYFP